MGIFNKIKFKYSNLSKRLDYLENIIINSDDEFTKLTALHEIEDIRNKLSKDNKLYGSLFTVIFLLLIVTLVLVGR